MVDVVDTPYDVAVNGNAYDVKPLSLLNQESCTEDEAIELTLPAEPMYPNPCERDESLRSDENVDDAVEKTPFNKPSVVVVELYPVLTVNGNADVENPASLLNQERLTEDEAIELAFPADPIYAKP